MRVLLVINEWGGVPATLHDNVLRSQSSWSVETADRILLPHTHRNECLARVLQFTSDATIFDLVRERGGRTTLLGPTPGWREAADRAATTTSAAAAAPQTLADPRHRLAAHGVDRCSLHCLDDGAFVRRGMSADAYDDDVCDQARRVLEELALGGEDDTPHLVWINFLCCADVAQARVRSTTAAASPDTFVPPDPTLVYHHRSLPASVTAYVDGISHLGSANATTTTGMMGHAAAARNYTTLLDLSWKTFARHESRVQRLLLDAVRCGAMIARTATHSLAIGECGVRGGHVPLGVCCETFWASSQPTTTSRRLEDRVLHLIATLVDLPQLPTSVVSGAGPRVTHGTMNHDNCVGLTTFARVLVTVREHTYACIFQDGTLRHIFDTSIDREETRDVYAHVAHLLPHFREAATEAGVSAPRKGVGDDASPPTPPIAPLSVSRPPMLQVPPSPSSTSHGRERGSEGAVAHNATGAPSVALPKTVVHVMPPYERMLALRRVESTTKASSPGGLSSTLHRTASHGSTPASTPRTNRVRQIERRLSNLHR